MIKKIVFSGVDAGGKPPKPYLPGKSGFYLFFSGEKTKTAQLWELLFKNTTVNFLNLTHIQGWMVTDLCEIHKTSCQSRRSCITD